MMTAARRANRDRERSPGGFLAQHWRGEHDLLMATLAPCTLMLALWWLFTIVFDSIDWVWHHQLAAIAAFLLIVLLLCAAAWGAVGVVRTAKRADDRGDSLVRVYGASGLVMACAMGTAGQFGFATKVWLEELKSIAFDQEPRAEIRVEPTSGRLVISGEFNLGTTRRVRDVLQAFPAVRLVELDSPGGAAVEGLALAALLAARDVDTLVLRSCSSACISAFAAGHERFLGPAGRLGLHSASAGFRDSGKDVNHEHADFLQRRGVAQWLIDAERATPNNDILMPGHSALLDSGLVTDMWRDGP